MCLLGTENENSGPKAYLRPKSSNFDPKSQTLSHKVLKNEDNTE